MRNKGGGKDRKKRLRYLQTQGKGGREGGEERGGKERKGEERMN